MTPDWNQMAAVTMGSDYIKNLHDRYLPQEPREDEDAYLGRIYRSVLSPFCLRLIENAAGLVLRRPIQIDGDDYWERLQQKRRRPGLLRQRIRPPRPSQQPDLRPLRHPRRLPHRPRHPHPPRRSPAGTPPLLHQHRRPPNLGLASEEYTTQQPTNPSPPPRVGLRPRRRLRRKTRRTNPRHLPRPLRNLEHRRNRLLRHLQPRHNPPNPHLQQPNGHADEQTTPRRHRIP